MKFCSNFKYILERFLEFLNNFYNFRNILKNLLKICVNFKNNHLKR